MTELEAIAAAVARAADADDAFTTSDAVAAVSTEMLEAVLHGRLSSDGAGSASGPLASGMGASPGAAVGEIVLSADEAADAADDGRLVILVVEETTPADVHGMQVAEAIVTAKGGMASHAAVVARGWGIPAVVGVETLHFVDGGIELDGTALSAGDKISVDGAAGHVYAGDLVSGPAEAAAPEAAPTPDGAPGDLPDAVVTLLGWADDLAADGPGVRANADAAVDAQRARTFGASGIGLCRTEHQFLGERLPLIRAFILADNSDAEAEALAALADVQRRDFVELFEAMDGLPVTVRLLDPPLHEFLPSVEELVVAEATGTITEAQTAELAAVRKWSEANPMLGTRGVRLGIIRSGLYQMQIRALLDAAGERTAAGGSPRVEIMVPLVVGAPELAAVRAWVDAERERAGLGPGEVKVGAMVETPRAALVAGEIASVADFLSFGTNDLTQMTFGFSRDDVETSLMAPYLEAGLLPANPFAHLDTAGVGALVAQGVEAARAADPSVSVGVCGEHGGDPESIRFFASVGLNYVSCSPFRVPIARLALAHLALERT